MFPPGGSGERAISCHNQGHRLSPLPRGRQRRPLIRSITHAPDQTFQQPQLLQWEGRPRCSRPPLS